MEAARNKSAHGERLRFCESTASMRLPVTKRIAAIDSRLLREWFADYAHSFSLCLGDGEGGLAPKQVFFEESVSSDVLGLAVDYLIATHASECRGPRDAFRTAIKGARRLADGEVVFGMSAEEVAYLVGGMDPVAVAENLVALVEDEDEGVSAACRLTWFDDYARADAPLLVASKRMVDIRADDETQRGVREMVSNGLSMMGRFGRLRRFEVSLGGDPDARYIGVASADFTTDFALWDLKCGRSAPGFSARIQVLVYYLMGVHQHQEGFDRIKYLGLVNPRRNEAWVCPIESIDEHAVKHALEDVIGYSHNVTDDVLSAVLENRMPRQEFDRTRARSKIYREHMALIDDLRSSIESSDS